MKQIKIPSEFSIGLLRILETPAIDTLESLLPLSG